MTHNTQPAQNPSLLMQLWRQFSSMKFAIILLVVIAVVSVLSLFIGEFYPVKATGPGWQEYWQKELHLSKPVFEFFSFLRLHDPYHSWWYLLLLLLLAVSLLACIIDRLPKVIALMRWGTPRGSREIDQMALSRSFSASGTPDDIRKRLPALFRFRETQQGGEMQLIGRHGLPAHLGPIFAHSGLLALTLGGVIVLSLGYTSRIAGVPGEVMTDPGFGFTVRVDSFKIEYHALGIGQYVLVDNNFLGEIIGQDKGDRYWVKMQPHSSDYQTQSIEASHLRNQFDIETDRGNIKSYVSVLTVLENDQPVLQKRVEVNHPLRYKGFRFYQASFDPERPVVDASIDSARIVIKIQPGDAVLDTVFVSRSRPYILPDGSELHLARFLPDFRMDRGAAISASAELRNPALLMEVRRSGEEIYHQWVFLRPDFPHMASPQAAYTFQVLDISGFQSSVTYPTILEVNKSPGAWLIWLGFVLCTLGLILAFYLQPQRIWLAIKDRGTGRSEVHLGGSSSRNPNLFARKFEHWIDQIKGKDKT